MNRATALALFAAMASGVVGCGLNQEGVSPHPDTLFYPASAVLDPTAGLAYSTTYTATVRGGATDPRVKDLSGNALSPTRIP